MKSRMHALFMIALAALLALPGRSSCATSVQDLVRIKGHERNTLTGMGIVVGLNGTGDESKDSLVAARPYAALLHNLGNSVESIDELAESDSYAIVLVTLEVPPEGVREGDAVDVSVAALFNAESLEGGQLVVSMLRPPLPDANDLDPLALARGSLVIEGDNPRTAIVRGGGQMIADIRTRPVTRSGTMTLVLKPQYARYAVAVAIADAINDEYALSGYTSIAVVEDSKNIRVTLPGPERANPATFIATVMTIPIDSSLIRTEARIVINEKEGIIIATGNVTIGPVGITHRGLAINTVAADPADPAGAIAPPKRWVGLDTTDGRSRGSTQLTQLLAAFEQLQVPVGDQIAIIHELRKTGALHAEIISE